MKVDLRGDLRGLDLRSLSEGGTNWLEVNEGPGRWDCIKGVVYMR